jgi:hypothetical protein
MHHSYSCNYSLSLPLTQHINFKIPGKDGKDIIKTGILYFTMIETAVISISDT